MKTPPAEITGAAFMLFLEEAKKEFLTQEEMETYSKSLMQSYEVIQNKPLFGLFLQKH